MRHCEELNAYIIEAHNTVFLFFAQITKCYETMLFSHRANTANIISLILCDAEMRQYIYIIG